MTPGTPKEVIEHLEANNPDAMLLEPREFFDKALVGYTTEPDDHWTRTPGILVAVYDCDKTIEAIMSWLGCDQLDATEWYSFNTMGSWVGEGTPTFVCGDDSDD